MNKIPFLLPVLALLVFFTAHLARQDKKGLSIVARTMRTIDRMAADERDDFERQAVSRFDALTPEEQEMLERQAVQQWQALSPDQQRRLEQDAAAQYDAMTPQEQAAARARTRAEWAGMTPGEKNLLLKDLPDGDPTD